jgi:glyoxylate carboligase
VQGRHEELSAFEAVGYAKFTGRVGFCTAPSGPGAIHLLNGLYDARLDHVPVVGIVGRIARSAMGGSYQQEVDLAALFKDVAGEYCEQVTVPEQLPNVLDRAIRDGPPYRDRGDHPGRRAGAGVHGTGARHQDGAVQPGPEPLRAGAAGRRSEPSRGPPQPR